MDALLSFISLLGYPFISWGDFSVPHDFLSYFFKNVSVWLYQTGAANFDGIMRLPQRLPVMLVHLLFGSLTASYFFLAYSYAIVGISFYIFLRYFIDSKNTYLNLVLSAAVTLSPALLGNTSKIGLVTAAASVLLSLVCIRYFFRTKKFIFLLILIVVFNLSLVHPYNIAVNGAICFIYLAYKILVNRKNSPSKWVYKLIVALPVMLLMYSYFIFPVIANGSIDKSAVTQEIGASSELDYTDIIYVSNAGDPVTALSLSKNVFIDYDNHNGGLSKTIFITSQLCILILLIGLYTFNMQRLKQRDKYLSIIFILMTLLLLAMSSGHSTISNLLAQLVTLPGGWIFRSPLKWQLYAPLFLYAAMAVQIRYFSLRMRTVILFLIATLVLISSGYQLNQIRSKLLTPRNTNTFTSLPNLLPQGSRLLYMSGQNCIGFARDNPEVMAELNQHFITLPTQVKRISQTDLGQIRLRDFNYMLTCKENENQQALSMNGVKQISSYVHDTFKLYQIDTPVKLFEPLTSINLPAGDDDVNMLENASTALLNKPYNYTPTQPKTLKDIGAFTQLFNGISRSNITDSGIKIHKDTAPASKLISKNDIYYRISDNNTVEISDTETNGFTYLQANEESEVLPSAPQLTYNYTSSPTASKNTLGNGDIEATFIGKEVADCFAYDNNAQLDMRVSDVGQGSMDKIVDLSAKNHIACIGTPAVKLSNTRSLLVSLDAMTSQKNTAGFSVQFNDPNKTTITERYRSTSDKWNNYAKLLAVPDGSTTARLILYGYPGINRSIFAHSQYNNAYMSQVPDALSNVYVSKSIDTNLITSFEAAYTTINPTHHKVTITGASGMGILKMSDTFNSGWRLIFEKNIFKKLPIEHIAINSQDNAWIIDFDKLCTEVECLKNSDGTYSVTVDAYYMPQLAFISGGVAGIITLMTALLLSRKTTARKTR